MGVSKTLRYQILRRDGYKCHYCGSGAPHVSLHIDHVIPEALGGTNDPSNLLTACSDCNAGKAATPADAAVVAQVDERNVAWASAMDQARQGLHQAEDEQKAHVTAFLNEWERYGYREPDPLPADYGQAVLTWIDRGLTQRDFEHLLAVTYSKAGLWRNERFRYFAGCCWRRLSDLEQAAERIMREGEGG